MDIEFHYYMTYLVAAKAGFKPEDVSTLAYASQYVDDNDVRLEVDKGLATAYRNYISQTMNILKPKDQLFRIYPLFHFIPGDPRHNTAWRKDGKMHWLNTTPNSDNANLILDAAIASRDLYRIGIACHCYVDTWAHQNFVGYFEDFNAMKGPLQKVAPNIGHADAGHNPDWPALVWDDDRLTEGRVDNKPKFLEAAGHLFEKLARFVDGDIGADDLEQSKVELVQNLSDAIGDRDDKNDFVNERISRYKALAETAAYGDDAMPEYDPEDWLDDAINEEVRGFKDRSNLPSLPWTLLPDVYTWKDRDRYTETHWYCFQKAVKDHQNESWEILKDHNFKTLELPQL